MSAQPSDPDAELEVLGSMLVYRQCIPEALDALDAGDFYLPQHARLFSAISALHRDGHAPTDALVQAELRKLGQKGVSALPTEAIARAELSVRGAVRVVAEMALRRRLVAEGIELRRMAEDGSCDASEVLEGARERLAAIDAPLSSREPDDESFEGFVARTSDKPTPWLLRGLLRQLWRVIVVAAEGAGKTTLLRQLAVCAAYGLHPFRSERFEPVPTLLVDCENPEDHLNAGLARMCRQARAEATGEPVGRLWHRPGGIDLRKRSDRAELEAVIAKRRPQLLVAGPLYKLMRVQAKEPWELAAREVQAILDDWRARYGLSMVLEDHAPQESGGRREMRPYGSSLWLRWPEMGIALERESRDQPSPLKVSRWRGDRMPNDWPTSLARSTPWPWEGHWQQSRADEAF